MATIQYTIELEDSNPSTSYQHYGSLENALSDLKVMAYDVLATVTDLDYSIEAMSSTAFELNVLHDNGTSDNYYIEIV